MDPGEGGVKEGERVCAYGCKRGRTHAGSEVLGVGGFGRDCSFLHGRICYSIGYCVGKGEMFSCCVVSL